MSTAARRKGGGKLWEVPAAPAVPDSGAPAKPKSRFGNVQKTAPAEGSIESVRRRLQRLALDVHDGPMQNLAVIGFSLGDLRRKMQSLVPVDHQAGLDAGMEQIGAELGRVEEELRALIGALEHGGVMSIAAVDAIELEIAEFRRRSKAEINLTVDGEIRTETDSQRIALQSVTRAALANVVKHAAANTVNVRLRGTPDAISVQIEDDGRGFRPDAPRPKSHLGLTGMRERVEMLGGELTVESRPGGPTKITATLQTWRPPAA
jgi:signal transduction histidine kinase